MHPHQHLREPIELGSRPLFLVNDLAEGPLKSKLLSCAQGPFRRTDFTIGHRGACLGYPEHTRESYLAAARQGAGFIECDVTFTQDLELVCRHAQDDLHTTTDILIIPDLAAKCTRPFVPARFNEDDNLLTPASAECRTSDLTLAESAACAANGTASTPAPGPQRNICRARPWPWWGWRLGRAWGTPMTHRESITLFLELGVQMIPELKTPVVTMPFGGLTQEAFAQKLIDDYKAAGVNPRRVWPQSFDRRDIRYWLANEPGFRPPGGLLGGCREGGGHWPSPAALQAFKAEGINIIAPPLFALLEGDATGAIRPSAYARAAQAARLGDCSLEPGAVWEHRRRRPGLLLSDHRPRYPPRG